METFAVVRQRAWIDAGFGGLRKIRFSIEDWEPWFVPEVFPKAGADPSGHAVDLGPERETTKRDAECAVDYPQARYYSAADYRRLYLAGELTPTDVARALLPLIRRDAKPPGKYSTAWFDSKEQIVLDAAAASTQRYREKRSLGPLDGVPTAVKDEFDMDGYTTCLGSRRDFTGPVLEDGSNRAWCVRKLEEAGAVIMGKTSMHEFGLDTPGNNPIYGTPTNPHNAQYYTGGSSSGTAYCVSAGLIPVGLGSDGGGSVRIPASMCGIFSLKPSHNRISCKPSQNHSNTCAVNGPIAADVESLTTLFEVLAQPHPTSPFPPMGRIRLEQGPGHPRVIGIPEAWFARATPAMQELCRGLIKRMVARHNYTVVPVEIPFLSHGQIAHAMTVLTDAATLLPETRGLTPGNRIMLALGRVTPATDYLLAQKLRRVLMEHLAWLWQQHPGMVLVTPTTSCAGWPILTAGELRYGISDGDRTLRTMEYVWLANFCGNPSITVPAGFVVPEGAPDAGQVASVDTPGKIPVGLMATGEWCAEEQLLQFAWQAERASADLRNRPPIWLDLVEEAKKLHKESEQ